MASISTRTGDKGDCALMFGRRVRKTDPRVEANGALDEWSAFLGAARGGLAEAHPFYGWLRDIQKTLVGLMGEIALDAGDRDRYRSSGFQSLSHDDVEKVESWLKKLEERVPPMRGWAFPGDHRQSTAIEIARAVGRRAERRVVAVGDAGYAVPPDALPWLNRCSDLLWLMGRALDEGLDLSGLRPVDPD